MFKIWAGLNLPFFADRGTPSFFKRWDRFLVLVVVLLYLFCSMNSLNSASLRIKHLPFHRYTQQYFYYRQAMLQAQVKTMKHAKFIVFKWCGGNVVHFVSYGLGFPFVRIPLQSICLSRFLWNKLLTIRIPRDICTHFEHYLCNFSEVK